MDNGFKKCTLIHEKDFDRNEVENMVIQATLEMKSGAVRCRYGTFENYMCAYFGFKKERRKYFEYNI